MNMDDKKEPKQESTETNPNEGIQSKTVETLDRADEIAERQKRENDRKESLLEREEALAARKAVGGETEAGTETKPEFTDEEKAARKRIGDIGRASGASWAKNYE